MARRVRITFKATKIISKPAKIRFQTKNGKEVVFKAKKDIPSSIKVTFLTKRRKK